jgi:tetratricopeptide (TPR) repeat protein
MRKLIAATALMGAVAACQPAAVDVQAQIDACEIAAEISERIAACTTVTRAAGVSAEARAQAFVNRGAARSNIGEQARAVADFGRALRLNSNLAAAYFERALVHHARGGFDSAVADYDRALAIDPTLESAAYRRALALTARIEDFATLLVQANSRIEADPENPANWNNRCWIRAVEGVELDAALADCNRSITLAPTDPNTFDSRGLVYLKLNNPRAALADYEAAVRLNENAHFVYGRGLARLRLGLVDEGQADLRRAAELQSDIAETYAAYGVAPFEASEAPADEVKKP